MNDYKSWVKSIIATYNGGGFTEKPTAEQAMKNEDSLDELTELFKTHYESSSYYDPNIGSEFDQAFDEALGYVLDALDEKCRKEC